MHRLQKFGLIGLVLLTANCGSRQEVSQEAIDADMADTALPVDDTSRFIGALEGMKGTRPVAVTGDWRQTLDDFWTSEGNESLTSYQYAAEAYDSVVIAALAAESAQTDGNQLADQIVGLSRDGTKCLNFEDCRRILRAGGDVDYDGKSGKFTMNGRGEVVETQFSIVEFGSNNRIDNSRTKIEELDGSWEFLPFNEPRVERNGDGVLRIGTVLPLTGQLAPYGPPQCAGVEFAISEINRVGGVLGRPVEYVPGDSGDSSSDAAEVAVAEAISAGVDVLIGPSSTTVTIDIIDAVLAAGIVQISPANTNMQLVNFPDGGLYFRAAPADDQQTFLLSKLIARENGKRVFIAAVDDLYGNSIADRLMKQLVVEGIDDSQVELFNPASGNFVTLVAKMVASESDSIVVVGFDESARILHEMVRANIGPKVKKVFGVDANMGDGLGENFDTSG